MSIFDRSNPEREARARITTAVQSVQSSLFSRLRAKYPGNRSEIAWALVRLGQGDHQGTPAARADFEAAPLPTIQYLQTVVRVMAARPGQGAEVTHLAQAIERELSAICLAKMGRTPADPIAALEKSDPEAARWARIAIAKGTASE